MTLDLERVRSVLHAAVEALTDLGACDDEDCQEPNCNHALPRVKELLAELHHQALCNANRQLIVEGDVIRWGSTGDPNSVRHIACEGAERVAR